MTATSQHQPELTGQTVVIGGVGIGLGTARQARAEDACIIRTGCDPDLRARAAAGLGALSSAACDVAGPAALDQFSGGLAEQMGHVMVTAVGPAVR